MKDINKYFWLIDIYKPSSPGTKELHGSPEVYLLRGLIEDYIFAISRAKQSHGDGRCSCWRTDRQR